MTKLSVNINKVATLRNARGGAMPNVLQFALDIEKLGAEGITVHPRPDQRHITYADVRELKENIATELNVEGYPSADFMQLVKDVAPAQVTLVPDPPGVLTSNAGWDVLNNLEFLQKRVAILKSNGIRTSIFIDTDNEQIKAAAMTGVDRIELYTESYANNFVVDREKSVRKYVQSAVLADQLGLQVNAGHDLNLQNLAFFYKQVTPLHEVSIGHALICDALYLGIEKTIVSYLDCLR